MKLKILFIILFSFLLVSCSNNSIDKYDDEVVVGDFTYTKIKENEIFKVNHAKNLTNSSKNKSSSEKPEYRLTKYTGEDENLTIFSTFTYNKNTFNVTAIGNSAITKNQHIKHVTIEEGITAINAFNFSDCLSLETISIPNTVTHLGASAISNTKIETLTLPDSDLTLEESTFSSNTYLHTVYLGHSKKAVASFVGCSSLENLYITSEVNNKDNTSENIEMLKGITSKNIKNVYIEGEGNFKFENNTLYFKDEVIFTTNTAS